MSFIEPMKDQTAGNKGGKVLHKADEGPTAGNKGGKVLHKADEGPNSPKKRVKSPS